MTKNFQYIILLSLLAVGACAMNGEAEQYHVRVAILKNAESVALSGRGRYTIQDPTTDEEILSGRKLGKTNITLTPHGFQVGDQMVFAKKLRINARKDITIYGEKTKKRYRGNIDILREKGNTLLVLNTLPLEDYVKGVLYHEVPHYWPMNAIKAQAVATRTYALFRVQERAKQLYDVTSDIYSQVYGGRSAERYRATLAANRTRGEILTYKGSVLPAYFHSTCGGETENVLELWDQHFPPLYGVKCGFCTKSPHYRWTKNFRSKDVQDKLIASGYKIGLIQKIDVIAKTKSGRVKTLKITARDGGSIMISGTKFRGIIGPNVLKSNKYRIEMKGYYFDVIGSGWGHGVGMCQWGAYFMAKQRYSYTSILNHYYPGAQIENIAE